MRYIIRCSNFYHWFVCGILLISFPLVDIVFHLSIISDLLCFFLFAACHFNLTAESGKFDFPIPSYPWRKCHFSIDVSSGKIININFTGSSFPKASYYCSWTDYIAIYESSFSASNLMRKICNNGSTVYRSYGNTVYLEFLSSSSRVFASYSAVNLSEY